MALVTLPTKFGFTRIERFQLSTFGNVFRSRYTGQRQMVTYPFAVWELEGQLVDYDGVEAAAIRAFFVKLKGQQNSFKLPTPGYSKPASGFALSNVTASAADARATAITLNSVGSANAQFLRVGDYFTVNDELKMVTADAPFGAGASVVVTFEPPLRKAVVDGTAVTVQNPYVLLNAADDDIASWGLQAPVIHSFKFEAIEAFVL